MVEPDLKERLQKAGTATLRNDGVTSDGSCDVSGFLEEVTLPAPAPR